MLIATIYTTWTGTPRPIRYLKQAQLAASRVLGPGVTVLPREVDHNRGVYEIVMAEPQRGMWQSKTHRAEIHIQRV